MAVSRVLCGEFRGTSGGWPAWDTGGTRCESVASCSPGSSSSLTSTVITFIRIHSTPITRPQPGPQKRTYQRTTNARTQPQRPTEYTTMTLPHPKQTRHGPPATHERGTGTPGDLNMNRFRTRPPHPPHPTDPLSPAAANASDRRKSRRKNLPKFIDCTFSCEWHVVQRHIRQDGINADAGQEAFLLGYSRFIIVLSIRACKIEVRH